LIRDCNPIKVHMTIFEGLHVSSFYFFLVNLLGRGECMENISVVCNICKPL
jgi:hypothetical protein